MAKSQHAVADGRANLLFVRLWNTVARREDAAIRENFFSECVAGALNADLSLARDFARVLNGGRDRIGRTSIARADVKVTSQFSCTSRQRQCYVDMRVDVGDEVSIGVEVKLDAPEGALLSGDRQLKKYLQIPRLTHVAYITGYNTSVEPSVLKSRLRYLKPHGRDHFLWSDFYPLIAHAAKRRIAPELHAPLLALFHARHLEPAHPDLPDLSIPEGRAAFRPLWSRTRQALASFYSDVKEPRINATMYAWKNDYIGAWKVALEPAVNPGLLRIWLYMENAKVRNEAVQQLRGMFAAVGGPFRGASVEPRVGAGIAKAGISIWLPYRSVFSRRSSWVSKEARLAQVVTKVIATVNGKPRREAA